MGPTDELTSLLPSKRVRAEFGLKPHFGSLDSSIMGIYTYNGAPTSGRPNLRLDWPFPPAQNKSWQVEIGFLEPSQNQPQDLAFKRVKNGFVG